ncbi:hypothetical protein [Rhizobium leguminosarum]|uniref:hypothetical protein n=1 Tax=Rhizobium leguminosarum TaxID=384 RepID=UPI000482F943|nr:hypothetical protein [Rhizobium leguminosarum]
MYDGRAVRHTWLLVLSPLGVSAFGAAVAEIEAVRPKAIEEAASKAGHIERDSRDASHAFFMRVAQNGSMSMSDAYESAVHPFRRAKDALTLSILASCFPIFGPMR